MKLLKKLINFWQQEDMPELETPLHETNRFMLNYKKLPIGTLEINQGIWQFNYSEDFKNQHEIVPLIDFPNTDRIYQSRSLWPFFLSRIPSTNSPAVGDIVKKKKLNADNPAEMLSEFGRRTITNPFELMGIGA
jgi:HipA-like protein